jgi:hypothetical protein
VTLPARMRSASGWSDACILNISSRGLLIYSRTPAEPGSYVEIRRDGRLVVGRVVWRQNQRMGLSSPDPIHIDDIVNAKSVAADVRSANRVIDRRRVPRTVEQSRARARAVEFLATVLLVTGLAGWGVAYVHETMATPLTAASDALARGGG